MTLDDAARHIGHGVEYQPGGRRTGRLSDKGIIRTVRGTYVMVEYAAGPGGAPRIKATSPADLVLIAADRPLATK